ncbi:MAG TPA: hypothetical protein VFX52_09940 [Nocardioidaceae bacterium]|nr:hypothetical protein [Nocardioidaceae bacterium]
MTDSPAPARRVRVSSPRVGTGRPRPPSVSSEIDAQTELGEVYVRSLVRSQLLLAVQVTLALGLSLGLLPVLFALVPASRTVRVAGLPLPWLLLGVVVYPCLVALGWLYVRRAERNERAFAELVDRR